MRFFIGWQPISTTRIPTTLIINRSQMAVMNHTIRQSARLADIRVAIMAIRSGHVLGRTSESYSTSPLIGVERLTLSDLITLVRTCSECEDLLDQIDKSRHNDKSFDIDCMG